MQIVYVSRELVPSLRCGGIGSYVWDLGRQLVNRGCHVTVVCASDDTRAASDACIEGVRIIRLPGGDFAIPGIEPAGENGVGRRLRELTRFGTYRRSVANCLNMLIRDRRAEIVELAEYGHESAEWIRHPRTIPMVVRIHGPASRLGGRRVRWRPWNWLRYRRAFCEYDGVRSADAVSCPSASMAQLVRIDGRLDTLPIEIIPNAVVSDAWEQTQEDDRPVLARRPNALSGSTSPASATAAEPCGTTCEQIMLNPRRKTLFTAGTVVPAKGMLELVQAVELLRGRGHDLRLNIAGKWGALGRSLHRRYGCRTDQPAWLTLLGHVPREQLRTLYRTSDLVCFPSWWENCPCTCLEAMSSGGLVLGSTSGGMSEIIRDGHDGFLVHPRNPQALALRIEQVLELNREDQDRVRRNARRRIRESYDVDVIVPKMLAFYEQVIRNCWNQRVQARSYA